MAYEGRALSDNGRALFKRAGRWLMKAYFALGDALHRDYKYRCIALESRYLRKLHCVCIKEINFWEAGPVTSVTPVA